MSYWLNGGILLSLLVDEKFERDEEVDPLLEAVVFTPELVLVRLLLALELTEMG